MKSLAEILESPASTTTASEEPKFSSNYTDSILENSNVEVPEPEYPPYMKTAPGAVGYETEEVQNATYGFALRGTIPITGHVTILDIGAGRGDLIKYIKTNYPSLDFEYLGYEINKMLSDIGNESYSGGIINDNFLNADETDKYDYVFLIGSLNVNYGWEENNWSMLESILNKALSVAKISVTCILLHDAGGFDMYNSFPIPNLTDLILKYNLSFSIDFDAESEIYKLTIKKR